MNSDCVPETAFVYLCDMRETEYSYEHMHPQTAPRWDDSISVPSGNLPTTLFSFTIDTLFWLSCSSYPNFSLPFHPECVFLKPISVY